MSQRKKDCLSGYGIRLRPVDISDAEFILNLRNMPHANGNIPSINITIAEEKAWLAKNILDENDFFYIVESNKMGTVGTIGIYNINFAEKKAQIGRLVILPNSLDTLAAFILLHDFSFEELNLNELSGWAMLSNTNIMSMTQRMGYKPFAQTNYDGTSKVFQKLIKSEWTTRRKRLVTLAERYSLLDI